MLLIAALVIGVVISLSVISLWWLKNVLRHRLPKPFLGEGTNMEWAELKRAELMSTKIESEDISTTTPEDVGPSIWSGGIPQKDIDGLHSDRNGGDSQHLSREHAFNNESLLQAWLAETGHIDDDWAEKLFGNEGQIEET